MEREAQKIVTRVIGPYDETSPNHCAAYKQRVENAIKELDQLAKDYGLSLPEIILMKSGKVQIKKDFDNAFSNSYADLYCMLDGVNKAIRSLAFEQIASGKKLPDIAKELKIEKSEIYRLAMV